MNDYPAVINNVFMHNGPASRLSNRITYRNSSTYIPTSQRMSEVCSDSKSFARISHEWSTVSPMNLSDRVENKRKRAYLPESGQGSHTLCQLYRDNARQVTLANIRNLQLWTNPQGCSTFFSDSDTLQDPMIISLLYRDNENMSIIVRLTKSGDTSKSRAH